MVFDRKGAGKNRQGQGGRQGRQGDAAGRRGDMHCRAGGTLFETLSVSQMVGRGRQAWWWEQGPQAGRTLLGEDCLWEGTFSVAGLRPGQLAAGCMLSDIPWACIVP